ncbi:MAG: hypothetical protein LBQ61_06665 [Spirochaetales bacterium]|nr:hypothetical protein [Spirochaetales bacterium]
MKKARAGILALSAALTLFIYAGCASRTPEEEYPDAPDQPVRRTSISNQQDSDGGLLVLNDTGHEVILFINGNPHKRIATSVTPFRVKIDRNMLAENTLRAQVSLYPTDLFAGNDYRLTEDLRDKQVFIQLLDDNASNVYEAVIRAKDIEDVLAGTRVIESANTIEFICSLSSDARNILVDLYSDPACTQRFNIGSLSPGRIVRVFKNPEELIDATIYAKYTRNDGRAVYELARGIVKAAIPMYSTTPIPVPIPTDYRNLPGVTLAPAGRGILTTKARLVIENTRPIDNTRNNNLVVYLGSDSTVLGSHPDVGFQGSSIQAISYSTIPASNRREYDINLPQDGTSYMIYLIEAATGRAEKIFTVSLNYGEVLYLTAPGVIPSQINAPNEILTPEQMTRRVSFSSNVPEVRISYELVSTTFPGGGEFPVGLTGDTSRPSLSGQITPMLEGLTYNDAASVKIVFKAEKDGYIPLTRSWNFQMFLNAVNGLNIESFVMERTDF